MASSYWPGALVRLQATFVVSGTNTDPTTVTLEVKNPAGTISTYTYALAQVTKSAVGIYYKDVSVAATGKWWYRWEGTGAAEGASEAEFYVRDSNFD